MAETKSRKTDEKTIFAPPRDVLYKVAMVRSRELNQQNEKHQPRRFEPHELFALWYADYPTGKPVLDLVFIYKEDAEAEKAQRSRKDLVVSTLDDFIEEEEAFASNNHSGVW